VLLLLGSALDHGFTSPSWMTFPHATELNAHIRKGEHGSLFFYANTTTKIERTAEGEKRHGNEPGAGWFRRFAVGVLSTLPIDWML